MNTVPFSWMLRVAPVILGGLSAFAAADERPPAVVAGDDYVRFCTVTEPYAPCIDEALRNLLDRRVSGGGKELDVEAYSLFDNRMCGIVKVGDFRDCSPEVQLVYAGDEYLVTMETLACALPAEVLAVTVWNTRTLAFEGGLLLTASAKDLRLYVNEAERFLVLAIPSGEEEGLTELVEFSGWEQGDVVLDYAETEAELEECLKERRVPAERLCPVKPVYLGDADAVRQIPQLAGLAASFCRGEELLHRLDLNSWQLKPAPVAPVPLPDWAEQWCAEEDIFPWDTPVWLPQKNWLCVPVYPHCWLVAEYADGVAVRKDYRIYTGHGDSWAVVAGDFMYHGSPDCSRMLGVDRWGRICGAEPLRVLYQRPLEVMMRVKCPPETLRNHRDASRLLIRKLGFTPDTLPVHIHPGELPAVTVSMPPLFAAADDLSFSLRVQAGLRGVVRLPVSVNGDIMPQPTLNIRSGCEELLQIDVPLEQGENWVEIGVNDAAGFSSQPVRFRIIRQ